MGFCLMLRRLNVRLCPKMSGFVNWKSKLSEFIGSDRFFRSAIFREYIYTEGVQFLAEQAGVYWLLDYIFSKQEKELEKHTFQVWKILVLQDESATIILEDGDENVIKSYQIDYTDFPLKEFTLWFINKTLLLSNEY